MSMHNLIVAPAVIPSLKATNKKQALLEISERVADVAGLQSREVFDALLQRERLGSTGVGNGIAIPHGKLPKCSAITGAFARLERPIDFESVDGAPVDLIFALVAPESAGADHLKALARIARALRDERILAKLRHTRDPAALFAVLTQDPAQHAA